MMSKKAKSEPKSRVNKSKSKSVLKPNSRIKKSTKIANADAKGIVQGPGIGHDCC